MLLLNKKYDKAIFYYKKALEIDPDNSMVYRNLGFLYYLHVKDYKKALYYFEKTIALEPDQKDIINIIDELKNKMG